MDVEDIRRIAVVGVGEIGHQVAQEFAMAGYEVHLNDTGDEKIQRALDNIRRNLRNLIDAGFITAQKAETVMPRIKSSSLLKEAVSDVDVVVEAVYENVALKQQIFRELDRLCPERTILASNSSTLMPRFMASVTKRPDKVLVAHYINPPFLLPVVELVRCKETSDETVKTMHDLYTRMGKTPVIVQKEVPGFIVNRLQCAMCREALHIVEQGIASPQDVDRVVRDSFGRRLSTIGVFDFMDGALDVIFAGFSNVFPDLSNTSEVSPLIKEKVERGELGWKTGKGFYEWTPKSVDALRKRLVNNLVEIAKWPRE